MSPSGYGKYFVFLTMALLRTVPATPLERHRRLVTPTMQYPVPTKPSNPFLLGSALVTAVPVRCPLKRDVGDRMRLTLDDDLMRQIYLQEVGDTDHPYVAQTLAEAQDKLHRLHIPRKQVGNVKPRGMLTLLQQWLNKKQPNTTRSTSDKDVVGVKQGTESLHDDAGLSRKDRIKRNADGSTTRVEFCTPRGIKTADGYLHMCASCAMTTVLPDDRFPRYINEVACDQSDCDCFTVQGTANGKCNVRTQSVKMLRKKANGCRMTIHGGQQVITDDWEIYDYPLRVGCECVINKLSMFATFIPKPSG